MDFTTWLSLAAICLLGAMTPGQSFIVILKHALAGRLNGLSASIGHGLGIALYALLTVVGLAIVIKETPWLFNLIKFIGVAFLVWLAYQGLRAKASSGRFSTEQFSTTLWKSFYEGLMIACLNPKIILFFLALFSQFVEPDAAWQQNAVLIGTVTGIDTLWYCLLSLVLSHSRVLNKLREKSHIVEKFSSLVLLTVAFKVML